MENKVFESITNIIESRSYLLNFQKEALIADLENVKMEDTSMEEMETILDRILWRLFGKSRDSLTTREQNEIWLAWKG